MKRRDALVDAQAHPVLLQRMLRHLTWQQAEQVVHHVDLLRVHVATPAHVLQLTLRQSARAPPLALRLPLAPLSRRGRGRGRGCCRRGDALLQGCRRGDALLQGQQGGLCRVVLKGAPAHRACMREAPEW